MIEIFSFDNKFISLFVLIGPGAIFINVYFLQIILKDLNKELNPDLIELEIISSSEGCFIIYEEIKNI